MESKIKKIKRIFSVFWWIMAAATVALLVCVLGAKLKGEVPKMFGYSVIKIVTGSMEPEIPTNSYILVKETSAEDIKKGDIISFHSKDATIYGLLNTHRVHEEPIKTETGYEFVTKGDANLTSDGVNARSEDVVGVYVGNIEWLTAFDNALQGNTMILILVVLQMGIIAVVFCSSMQKSESDVKKTEKKVNFSDVLDEETIRLLDKLVEAQKAQMSASASREKTDSTEGKK